MYVGGNPFAFVDPLGMGAVEDPTEPALSEVASDPGEAQRIERRARTRWQKFFHPWETIHDLIYTDASEERYQRGRALDGAVTPAPLVAETMNQIVQATLQASGMLWLWFTANVGTTPPPAAPPAPAGPGGLIHLTSPANAASIESSGTIIGQSAGIYASPASVANSSSLSLTLRTGVTSTGASVQIPASAASAFSQPVPIGLLTSWQRLAGNHYTARGNLNLATGTFTRAGVNLNQLTFYGVDLTLNAAVITTINASQD
jgi:hypothetical protein